MAVEHEDLLRRLRRDLAEAQIDRAQLEALRRELERAERELSRIPDLVAAAEEARRRLEIEHAEQAEQAEHERQRQLLAEQAALDLARCREERDHHAAQAAVWQEHADRANRALRDLKASPSWLVTRPLRLLKRLLT